MPCPTGRVRRVALPGKVVAVDTTGSLARRRAWAAEVAAAIGVAFVVDSSDRARLPLARDLLQSICKGEPEGRVAVLAHKQDVPGALPPEEISAALGLDAHPALVRLLPTVISQTEGLRDALRWVLDGARL